MSLVCSSKHLHECVCLLPWWFCPERRWQTGYYLWGWRRPPWRSEGAPETLDCTTTFCPSPTAWSACHLRTRRWRRWQWACHCKPGFGCTLTAAGEDVGLRGVDSHRADVVGVSLKPVNSLQGVVIEHAEQQIILGTDREGLVSAFSLKQNTKNMQSIGIVRI